MNTGASSFLEGAEIIAFDPNQIDVGGCIGFLHEDKAVAIGRLMLADGQRDIIKVSKKPGRSKQKFRLHVGLHRVLGARNENLPVYGIVVSGTPEQLADLEASENLHRRPLGPIERAKFVAALAQAAQERIARQHGTLDQHKLGAKARWDRVKHGDESADQALQDETDDAADKMSAAYSWQETVAEALKLGKREIRRSMELFRLLIEPFPELAEPLSRHPLVGENASQLKKITQVKDEPARRRVIEALLADREIKAEDAMINAGVGLAGADATPVTQQKFYDQIEGGWARLNLVQKRQFLPKIRDMLTDDMKRELRALLDEELD